MADSILRSRAVTLIGAFVAGMVASWWMVDPKGIGQANFDAGYSMGMKLTLDDVGSCFWGEHQLGYSFSRCMSQRAVSGKEWLHRYPDAGDPSK
jgi:hypothetical protein